MSQDKQNVQTRYETEWLFQMDMFVLHRPTAKGRAPTLDNENRLCSPEHSEGDVWTLYCGSVSVREERRVAQREKLHWTAFTRFDLIPRATGNACDVKWSTQMDEDSGNLLQTHGVELREGDHESCVKLMTLYWRFKWIKPQNTPQIPITWTIDGNPWHWAHLLTPKMWEITYYHYST